MDHNWELSNVYIIVAFICLGWGGNTEEILFQMMKDVEHELSKNSPAILQLVTSYTYCVQEAWGVPVEKVVGECGGKRVA